MKTYKALVVEDVKDTSDYIVQRIKLLCPQITTIHQKLKLYDAYKAIVTNTYDIVFLDIQMPTGTSFDLLKRLSDEDKINFEIIFITGESAKQFALRAIKYSALDFLYKPLDDTELVIAVNKAIKKISTQNHQNQIELLLQRIEKQATTKPDKIALYLHEGVIEMTSVYDIMYLQADGVVTKIHLQNGTVFTVNRNLGFYKEMLIIDYDFVNASNSILVNPTYIKRYDYRNLSITLTDNTSLIVSRRSAKELREVLAGNKKGFKLSALLNFFKTKK